jgi:hypothetical protein
MRIYLRQRRSRVLRALPLQPKSGQIGQKHGQNRPKLVRIGQNRPSRSSDDGLTGSERGRTRLKLTVIGSKPS